MRHVIRALSSFGLLTLALTGCAAQTAQTVVLEGAAPVQQHGSTGEDKKAASPYGHVLGMNWGSHPGDFAEYRFTETTAVSPAFLTLRYARDTAGQAI